jgi:hypothetical protein
MLSISLALSMYTYVFHANKAHLNLIEKSDNAERESLQNASPQKEGEEEKVKRRRMSYVLWL